MDGITPVHDLELHTAKARLERAAGRRGPGRTDLRMGAETVFVDAPYDDACAYLADPASLAEWSPLFRLNPLQDSSATDGDAREADDPGVRAVIGTDEYDRPVTVRSTRHDLDAWTLIEQRHDYHGQHGTAGADTAGADAGGGSLYYPLLVIPTAYAFGTPGLPGVLVHRLFWFDTPPGQQAPRGRPMPNAFGGELVTIKRVLEDRAGNHAALGASLSFRVPADAAAPEVPAAPASEVGA
jgi:hypothetical protein